jgi:predicted GNAT superfamily acetyltransferase
MTDRLPYTPGDLGFAGNEHTGWVKSCRGAEVRFAVLRSLDELTATEPLQLDVFGMTERDLVSASELIVVAETGGEVYGAFVASDGGERMAGTLIGWGGYVDGRGRLVSDFLAIEPRYRNLGLGGELKRLQAARALERGFSEIVWTVDPLRAANARLNVEKLGATSNHYERDRYGEAFGVGLYGGMPTDRLHMSWAIASDRVRDRLLTGTGATEPILAAELPRWRAGMEDHRAIAGLPSDIDALLAIDPESARSWRMSLRETLEGAFAEGWTITGFIAGDPGPRGTSSWLLERIDHKDPA